MYSKMPYIYVWNFHLLVAIEDEHKPKSLFYQLSHESKSLYCYSYTN